MKNSAVNASAIKLESKAKERRVYKTIKTESVGKKFFVVVVQIHFIEMPALESLRQNQTLRSLF